MTGDDSVGTPPVDERDPDQAWFWTTEWQAGERDADADIAAGRTTVYRTVEEFVAALEDGWQADHSAA